MFVKLPRVLLKGGLRCMSLFSFLRKKNFDMNEDRQISYEAAVYALNGLQSNAAYLKNARIKRNENPYCNLQDTIRHLEVLGIKVDDLNHLNVIHVSGTKGKGSTCAFTESILRHHGLKTGFYSSPHLISVNERIRINGRPLEKQQFSLYFWQVFQVLQDNLKNNETMPTYFLFLTVMAFYVFCKEKVDVAVVEVGIGGLYDCTNIVKKPVVVGVTALGLDHVSLLGKSLDLIAKQKAGIFKPGVPTFTVSQPETALKVLAEKAQEVGCPIAIAPPLSCYPRNVRFVNLGIPGSVQDLNASLAVQLSYSWLLQKQHSGAVFSNEIEETAHTPKISSCGVPLSSLFELSDIFCKGLERCIWPGRFYTVKKKNFTFYLDGAHTLQSMQHCVRWFNDVSRAEGDCLESPVYRVLIFNCTGERKPETLLDPLSEVYFDLVLFTPNCLSVMQDSASDQSNFMVDPGAGLEACKVNREMWCHMMRSFLENNIAVSCQSSSTNVFNTVSQNKYSHPENTLLFSSLSDTFHWLMHIIKDETHDTHFSQLENVRIGSVPKQTHHIQVLVTGSLHLVGGALSIIDPDLSGSSSAYES